MKPTQAQIEAAANTDRELWREREGDYYADSIHVTKDGGIGMNVGGSVVVMPIRKWFALTAAAQVGEPTVMGKSGYEYISSYDEIIAHTKLAVIKRCAQVADEHWNQNEGTERKAPGWDSACLLIASAIRKLKDAP